MKSLLYLFSILLIVTYCGASSIECVNVPTAEALDYGVGEFAFRIYSYGSIVTRFIFSPFNRINFGVSIDVKNLIGYDTPSVMEPTFYFKWRVFDGGRLFPAFALGYDGQSYSNLPAKNLYFAFSQNILYKKLFFDFGTNITKYFGEQKVLGFVSLRTTIEDIVEFGIEYENIGIKSIQQLNCKFGVKLAGVLDIDLIFNDLANKENRIERQIKVKYLYRFF